MADYDQIMRALRNAHAAGDTAAAQRLARMAQEAKGAAQAPAPATTPNDIPPEMADRMGSLLTREGQQARRLEMAQAGLPDGAQIIATFGSASENGRVYQLPDGTRGIVSAGGASSDPATVERVLAGDSVRRITQDSFDRQALDQHPIAARANEVVRGTPFIGSYADEAVGLVSPQAGAAMRTASGAMQRQNPYETAGLNAAGGVIGGGAMAAAAGPSVLAAAPQGIGNRVALAGVAGAVEGAVYGAGEGQGAERLANAKTGAAVGGALGGAIPVVGAALTGAGNRLAQNRALRRAIASAPSLGELRGRARALFSGADGVQFPRDQFTAAADPILSNARRTGMAPMVTPTAQAVGSNIEEAATLPKPTISFEELDTLRAQADVAAGHIGNPREAAIGAQMMDGIDDFMDDLNPEVAGQVQEARALWGRLRRSERIDAAFRRADLSASGVENGLRNEFRRILNSDKLRRGYSPEEIRAMTAVVKGTKWGNFLRLVGTAGMPTDQRRSFLGPTIGATAGNAVGGPIGAVALPAAATGLRAASEATTRRAAERARSLVAAGGVGQVPQIANEVRTALEAMLAGAAGRPANQAAPALSEAAKDALEALLRAAGR